MMEPNVPPWLDETFLEAVLRGKAEDPDAPSLNVVQFTAKPAAAVGNNYTSYVFRVVIEYKVGGAPDRQTAKLIVKTPIETGMIQELSEKMNLFDKEPTFYNALLPKMSDLVKRKFGPEIYFCPRASVLVFKDMNSEGYFLCDRQKQLDYSHCKIVLETLARFHAASVAYHHEDPTVVESLGKETIYVAGSVMEEQFKPFVELSIQSFIGVLKELECKQELIEYISNRSTTIWGSIMELCKRRQNGFNALNHGDCWTSNLLFKENESGEAIDVKLIDFQMLRYMSPAIDLVYFTWTSANEDVRENHVDSLYEHYRQTLNSTLEDINCEERMTSEELQESLRLAGSFALVMVTNTAPMMLTETESVMDTSEVGSDKINPEFMVEWYKKVYSGKTFQSLLPGYIRQIERWISSYGF